MRAYEIEKDIGVSYDRGKARAELEEVYQSADFEMMDKVLRQKLDNNKEAHGLVLQLKTRYGASAITNSVAIGQLLTLVEGILKSEAGTIGDIRREKRQAARNNGEL